MNQELICHTTKPEHAARNEELIRAVYAELRRPQPDSLRYAAFKPARTGQLMLARAS